MKFAGILTSIALCAAGLQGLGTQAWAQSTDTSRLDEVVVDMKCSRRSSIHFTGRFMKRATRQITISSG